jgi:hypothetical protein
MKNFITYKEPKMARVTDVNDSMHCYAEFDIITITAEFIENGQKWFVANQTGTNYQQQISAEEFVPFEISDIAKMYIGKKGEICSTNQSADKMLLHFFSPLTDVEIIGHIGDTTVLAKCLNEGMEQRIDIRDITFNI